MFNAILTKIVGSKNERDLKKIVPVVQRINELEPQMAGLSDLQLPELTDKFRQRLADGETLDDLLPEAFAAVREASKRVLYMRHFDVQLIGGMVLHHGKIAEMKTGEGQDARRHAAGLPERARAAKASTSSPSTITWPAATASGWASSTACSG